MYKISMKKAIKSYLKAVSSDEKDWLKDLLTNAYSTIDKAAKKGVIKKQTAARKKSRLAKKIA
jgi:small subunit ribosomal protein S20